MTRFLVLLGCAFWGFMAPVGAQVFDAKLRWEVGAVDGAEWETWMHLVDAIVLDNTLFVLDSRLPALRRFDLTGQFLGDVGGSGGGPGEFAVPGSLEPSAGGFTLLDQAQRRVTEYDWEGNHVRQVTLSSGPTRVWNVKGGWNVGFYLQPSRNDTSLVGVWRDSSPSSTLVKIENAFVQVRFGVGGSTFLPSIRIVGGVNGGASVLGDSALVVVDKHSILRVLKPNGTEWLETLRDTLPVTSERFLESDHESVLDIFLAQYENDPRLVDPEFPEYWPTWTKVQGSSAGAWIKQGGKEGSVLGQYPERWWLWQPETGAQLGVVMPSGTQVIRVIGSKFVVAKRTDDLDVEILQFFELVSRQR